MKELQRTAAFRAYNDAFALGDSMEETHLKVFLKARFFGNQSDPDSIGYAEQLVKGLGVYGPIYEDQEDFAKGNVRLRMKRMFHCLPKDIVCSSKRDDSGINMAVLTSTGLNNRSHLQPRALWRHAKLVETNGRKAMALVKTSEYATGSLPSGKTYDDYLLFLREGMWALKPQTSKVGGGEEEKDDDEEEKDDDDTDSIDDDDSDDGSDASAESGVNQHSKAKNPHPPTNTNNPSNGSSKEPSKEEPSVKPMKQSWFFPGFLSFALWGPIRPPDVDDDDLSPVFLTADDPSKKKERQRRSCNEPKGAKRRE